MPAPRFAPWLSRNLSGRPPAGMRVLLFFVAIYAGVSICWMFLNPNKPIIRDEVSGAVA